MVTDRTSVINLIERDYNVSRETISKLEIYAECLIEWQSKFNLIGKSTINSLWHRHILDSIQLVSTIPEDFQSLMDIGTGAGLPGFILAIYYNELGKDIYLVDSNKKKCTFLDHVATRCNVDVKIYGERLQDLAVKDSFKVDVITARAFASIDNIMSLSRPYSHKKTKYLLQKGVNAKSELTNAKISSKLRVELINSVTQENSYILNIERK
ncbi:MAG: 16S rRNA (guanine(527)-N(7))-methyltransferase RsmG [Rhodobiaceae bacterium]|nr:16S rRNA (guanine(527)-N(7))-methyltransferase RsmG [Rhodobiaceae bacterium]